MTVSDLAYALLASGLGDMQLYQDGNQVSSYGLHEFWKDPTSRILRTDPPDGVVLTLLTKDPDEA